MFRERPLEGLLCEFGRLCSYQTNTQFLTVAELFREADPVEMTAEIVARDVREVIEVTGNGEGRDHLTMAPGHRVEMERWIPTPPAAIIELGNEKIDIKVDEMIGVTGIGTGEVTEGVSGEVTMTTGLDATGTCLMINPVAVAGEIENGAQHHPPRKESLRLI